jgi:hypothetical protein
MANYQDAARQAARRYGLDEGVFLRQIRQESGFNPHARSPAGAIGIAQIMPGTAKGWGVNPNDPLASLNAAAKNMAGYVKKYGSYRNALIAYNAGPGAVGRGSLPAETQNYIRTILGGRNPGTSSVRTGGKGSTTTTTTSGGGTTTPLDQGSQQSVLPLLQALTQQSSGPPAASIQAPSFTAHPVLPEGFGTVSGGGPVQQGPDIGTLAAAVKTLGGNVPAAGQSTDTPSTASPTMDVSGNHPGLAGRVKFNPNADRPGVRTQAITKDFLARVAGFSHREITVGTGTNHNRMTTSGNVSDHWTGHAADIPQAIDSKLGDLTAAHALEAAGVPWSQAYAMARKGGVFNVTPKSGPFKGHRVQVLWKTMVGGNHHNHVHVGIR